MAADRSGSPRSSSEESIAAQQKPGPLQALIVMWRDRAFQAFHEAREQAKEVDRATWLCKWQVYTNVANELEDRLSRGEG